MNAQNKHRGWRGQLEQLGALAKNTGGVLGDAAVITGPVLRMSIYATVMVVLFFLWPVLVLYNHGASTWALLTALLMFFYKFFYYNRVGMVLSRLTYDITVGNPASAATARKNVAGLGRGVLTLGLLDMAGAWIAKSGKKDDNGMLARLLLGILAGAQDLVGNFLLPAFAIDRLALRDAIARLKGIRDHVPETLVGAFGIDVLGRIVLSLMAPLYMIAILAGILGGLLLGSHMPPAFSAGELGQLFTDMPDNWPLIGPHTVVSWFPLFIVIFGGCVINALFGRFVTAVKVVYFTLFYTRIEHGPELAPGRRAQLDNYLNVPRASP